MTINGLAASYCLTDPAVPVSGSPSPGILSGNGVIQPGAFDPAVAGVGTHTISYHHYYITTNPSSCVFPIFSDDFSANMGWTGYISGGWARGSATASWGCSGSQDPSADHTTTADNFIIGSYIGACYANNMPATYWLTSPVINCSGVSNCTLEFYSFSGCESSSFDHMYIEVFNGSWQSIYANATSFAETAWTHRNYSITQANNNPNFQIRFGMGSTDGSVTYQGWNIDDLAVKCSGTIMVTDTICEFTTTRDVVVFPTPVSNFTASGPVCIGDTSIISASFPHDTAYSYNWTVNPAPVQGIIAGQGPFALTWNSACVVTITLSVANTTTGCSSVVTTQNVQVVDPLSAPNCCITPTPYAGLDVSDICGFGFTMTANPPGAGNNAQWSLVSGPGIVLYNDSSKYNTDITVNQPGMYTFQWREISGVCDSSDQVTLSFTQKPIADIITNDTATCGLNMYLEASTGVTGSNSYWSVAPPHSSVFSPDSNSVNVDVTATSGYGAYTFIWTESTSATCFVKDSVLVYFENFPSPDAGSNQNICGNMAEINATLSPGAQGYWYSIPNTWYNASLWPNDTVLCPSCYQNPDVVGYCPIANHWVIFYWTEMNSCGSAYDSTLVYFGSIQTAISLVDPADSLICGRVFTGLNAQYPDYGLGYWYDDDTTSTFYFSSSAEQPDSVVIGANAWGYHNFYWITYNGCFDTSTAVVHFIGGGGIYGNISGLSGSTDYTPSLFLSGSPNALVTSTPDVSGNYYLYSNEDQYFLKVKNDLPEINTGIASTYYGNAWDWSEALLINVIACDTISADISMYTFPFASGGICRAYGTVMYDNGGPVEDADVYLLYKPVNTPAILELTDASGYYSLNSIPQGNYKIQVDIPGLPQITTHHITVNPFDTLFPDVNFIVDTTQIIKDYGWGIYADSNLVYGIGGPLSLQHPVSVYPVPFSHDIYLESYISTLMIIEWYSQDGKMILAYEANINEGRNRLKIPVSHGKGIFYLKIVTGNTIYIKKLIRE